MRPSYSHITCLARPSVCASLSPDFPNRTQKAQKNKVNGTFPTTEVNGVQIFSSKSQIYEMLKTARNCINDNMYCRWQIMHQAAQVTTAN